MASLNIPKEGDYIERAFSCIDIDGNGFLCDIEIDRFIASVGIKIGEEDLAAFKRKIDDPDRGDFIGKCLFQVTNKTISHKKHILNNSMSLRVGVIAQYSIGF